ncbi:MAG: DUF4150 domain-containing protein [Deltaproteobacteria bacterium]|jgi:hypothetical protein|nr:DUF4150 domain-containing protein [Deltaproteobacteria bacterium]
MFGLTLQGGLAINAPPDVCKIPTPGGPTPVPFPNIIQAPMAKPGTFCKKVMIVNSPAFTVKTKFLLSSGDEAGILGGVVSAKFIGPGEFMPIGSSKVNFEGAKAVYLTHQTKHNGSANFNTTGQFATGAQTKVVIAK